MNARSAAWEYFVIHAAEPDVDKDTIRWWIQSSAVYPGTYAALAR